MLPAKISRFILITGLVFLFLTCMVTPVSARVITPGDTIYIDETGLDITAAVGNISRSYLFGENVTEGSATEPVIQIFNVDRRKGSCELSTKNLRDFYADPACFANKTGQWTVFRPGQPWECMASGEGCRIIFTVAEVRTPMPTLTPTSTFTPAPAPSPTKKSPVGAEIGIIAVGLGGLLLAKRK
jgi:hypothetical protein